MLDDIMRMAMEALELTDAEVDDARKTLLAEVATVDARAAATDALWNPNGSTTRLENAVPSAQQKLSDHRGALIKAAPKFVALMLAVEVARQRRDDAEKMLQLKWKAGSAAGANGMPKEVGDWYPRLERHGVKRSYLGEFSNETIAIIADLIRWKAKDARFRDADNPWRQVLGIYAERVIVQPDRKLTATLSTPGIPTLPRHIGSSPRHYMFNDMHRELQPLHDQPAQAPSVSGMIDCSTPPAMVAMMVAVEPAPITAPEPAPTVDETAVPGAIDATSEPCDEGGTAWEVPAEIAVISNMNNTKLDILRQAAESLLEGDTDWLFDLKYELDQGGTTGEIIARVEAATPTMPMREFALAARSDGIEAGRKAYRAAVLRQNMIMIATDPGWGAIRSHLGLE